VGQVSEPLEILEGMAIVQVTGREPSQLRPFDAVEERARGLLRRKGADEAWTALVDGLRAAAKVEVDPRFYPELAAVADAAKAGAPPAR
jgi:parvulin-like peptidyl-prolyl isomerase